jgi:molybdate transport system ATP-binding protein
MPVLEGELSVHIGVPENGFVVESTLRLERGVLILFGPSGAGKSLTLQALAGLVTPRTGWLRLGGEVLYDSTRGINVPAHRRGVGYVPQHHALFPFRDILDNVLFGLPRRERRRDNARVRALMVELGINHLATARPAGLSGGERQRVALARALAVQPRLLLLDEPFASIDHDGRTGLRSLLREVLTRHSTPAVFVTHSAEEALVLGDTLVRFERGRTAETGAPAALLRQSHHVMLTGHAFGPEEPLADGRAQLTLNTATVAAPRELLRPDTDGVLRLDLRVRDRAGTRGNGGGEE